MTGWIAAGCTALALAATGCGGSSSASGTGSGGSKPVSGAKLELDDFYFKPAVIKAKPGQTTTLELHNEGRQAHTFTIPSQGVDQVVQPGRTARVQVTLPDKGGVRFICRFHHDMTGRLATGDAAGGASSRGGVRGYGY